MVAAKKKMEVVEAVLMVVGKEEMGVVIISLLQLHLPLLVVHHLQIVMVGTLIMKQVLFHLLQAIQVDQICISHHMGFLLAMMGAIWIIIVMACTVVGLVDMIRVTMFNRTFLMRHLRR